MKGNNTKQNGFMRMVFFREEGLVYGVCLDFDIVVHGADLAQVQKDLIQISTDYIKTVVKNNLEDSLLNRHAPKEYWDKYEAIEKESHNYKGPVLSTYLQKYPALSIA